jgi:hypothetical protein
MTSIKRAVTILARVFRSGAMRSDDDARRENELSRQHVLHLLDSLKAMLDWRRENAGVESAHRAESRRLCHVQRGTSLIQRTHSSKVNARHATRGVRCPWTRVGSVVQLSRRRSTNLSVSQLVSRAFRATVKCRENCQLSRYSCCRTCSASSTRTRSISLIDANEMHTE